jgi:hypothetical protein
MEEQEYIRTPELAYSLGVAPESIYQDIRLGNLLAEKRQDPHGDRWGGCWFVRFDHAQEYSDWVKKKQQSITARELARRTRRDDGTIRDAIHKGDLVAIRRREASRYPYYILEEDARAYSERMGWEYTVGEKVQSNGHKPSAHKLIAVKPIKGTPDRCGSCGTEIGNILADMDRHTGKKYGYLCIECDDFVRARKRMYKVLKYLEQTR